jgi:riboflavin kinase/FMN adenylyltransferase
MISLAGLEGLRQLPPGSVLSIGNFDGMHLGHQRILELGRRLASGSAPLSLITFEPHPLTVLRPGHAPPRLTPPHLKRAMLESTGVQFLVVLAPDPAVLDLTAEQFWEILRDQVRPGHMVEGASFTFGKGRGGTIERLMQWSRESGINLHVVEAVNVPLLDLHIVPVSSSVVRWLLANGRARDAAICLGRPYELAGEVIKGHQRGKDIGVPTANLRCEDQLIPADGVYSARAVVDEQVYPVALSIGTMPTFGENSRQVEAHLIGFDGDLYGRVLHVQVTDWLREQRKYANLEALKRQLVIDLDACRSRALLNAQRPLASIIAVA